MTGLPMETRDGRRLVTGTPEFEALVAERRRVRSNIHHLSELDRSPAPPLLLDRLDPLGPTITYGPGGIGKGVLAASWAARLRQEGQKVLILDYEDHPEEWARRVYGLAGDAAMDILHVPALREWGGAIWTHAESVREFVEAEGITYLIIDSAVMACAGTDPSSPDAPTMYSSGLQVIGVPSLTLAHVNRAHDARYPFGSVFWHNLARITWSLMPKGDERILVGRKHNNYAPPGAASVTSTWQDGVLREVWEKPAVWSLLDRIAEALADGPMSPRDITAVLNDGVLPDEKTSRNSVTGVLSRDLKANGTSSRFTVLDGLWTVRERD